MRKQSRYNYLCFHFGQNKFNICWWPFQRISLGTSSVYMIRQSWMPLSRCWILVLSHQKNKLLMQRKISDHGASQYGSQPEVSVSSGFMKTVTTVFPNYLPALLSTLVVNLPMRWKCYKRRTARRSRILRMRWKFIIFVSTMSGVGVPLSVMSVRPMLRMLVGYCH